MTTQKFLISLLLWYLIINFIILILIFIIIIFFILQFQWYILLSISLLCR